jgi:hypothetical protein
LLKNREKNDERQYFLHFRLRLLHFYSKIRLKILNKRIADCGFPSTFPIKLAELLPQSEDWING